MAKTTRKPKPENGSAAGTTTATANGKGGGDGESVAGYFRTIFEERPELLDSKSNAELLDRWLQDHPAEKEVPKKVKQNLANIKSVLRKQRRKKGRRKKAEQPTEAVASAPTQAASQPLESLEESIDECLTLAKNLDRGGLASVIVLLRRARNEVVWKMGQ